MYKIWVTKSALRHARRLPPDVRRFLVSKAKVLKEKPLAGYKLRGKLNFLYSLHLRIKGVEYRVIYEVDKKAKRIYIRYADTRENLYRNLEAMKIKSLVK